MRIGLPYRVAFSISTAIRLIPTTVENSTIILQAQMSRGLDMESGNIVQRLKKYIPVMIPAVVSVIRNTNVFAMALESRGFGFSEKRVNYTILSYNSLDYILSLVAVICIIVAIFIKLYFKI